jgi:F0F1-type ATP synthase assembly protein I
MREAADTTPQLKGEAMLKSEYTADIERARGAEAIARYRETYKPERRTSRAAELIGAVMLGAFLGVLLAIRG